jgi:hypothetical protein
VSHRESLIPFQPEKMASGTLSSSTPAVFEEICGSMDRVLGLGNEQHRLVGHQSKAMDVFQTSQTFPTRSGPGFNVIFPGFQPEGVASVPLLLRTSWKA